MTPIETTIVNRRDELARVPGFVDRVGSEYHLVPDVVADVQVALDEILTNIIDYGYTDDGVHEICIRFRILENVLEAVIEDDGVPFDPLASATPEVSGPLHERRVGGLGIHFVKNLMDEVNYDRIGDHNRLVLRKNLAK
jgi:serine/threonine-protein kinase RsbW